MGALVAGYVVFRARKELRGSTTPGSPTPADDAVSGSVVRSWIAISLVLGLLVFCAAAFMVNDTSLRSTLFGGLTTSVGAAVAFYFSSKSAEQAQNALIGATSQPAVKPTAFASATPGPAFLNAPYLYTFLTDQNATYSVASGRIPEGLTLAPTGALAGIPTAEATYVFAIAATNSAGSIHSDELTLRVINP